MKAEIRELLREQLENEHDEPIECSICEEPIPEGEAVYEVFEYKICADCMERCKSLA